MNDPYDFEYPEEFQLDPPTRYPRNGSIWAACFFLGSVVVAGAMILGGGR
jgi:hypothetical protein